MDDGADEYCIERRKPQESDKLLLLEECNGVCPLCGKPLLAPKRKRKKLFEVAHIYPNSPNLLELAMLNGLERLGDNSEDIKNWIALCHECHSAYDDHKTAEEYVKLLNRKRELLAAKEAKYELSEKGIEPELKNAAEALLNLSDKDVSELEKLSYNVLRVSEKIETAILCNKISHNAMDYFPFVREQFQIQEEAGGTVLFEKIAANIKHSYLTCKQGKLTESQTYEQLTNWIIAKAHCCREAAEILLSFFVQNCDVYEKISK